MDLVVNVDDNHIDRMSVQYTGSIAFMYVDRYCRVSKCNLLPKNRITVSHGILLYTSGLLWSVISEAWIMLI